MQGDRRYETGKRAGKDAKAEPHDVQVAGRGGTHRTVKHFASVYILG